MQTAAVYIGAALAEIAGCFAFWAWLRLGKRLWWLAPGVLSLIAFAYLLTLVDINAAGRAFTAYGGVYIAASLLWLWAMEGVRPDRWDVAGAAICLAGAAVILWGRAWQLDWHGFPWALPDAAGGSRALSPQAAPRTPGGRHVIGSSRPAVIDPFGRGGL